MQTNNSLILRAQMAERELAILTAKSRELFNDNVAMQRNHVYALRVIDDMGVIMQSRRHRLATWLGRIVSAPEMQPGALEAMLLGIRAALASMPAPAPAEPSEPAAPEAPATSQEPASALKLVGRDD